MNIRQRLRSILWRVPIEQEVREELAHHLELRTRELVDSGLEPAIARAEATRRFGDVNRMERRLADLGRERDHTYARQDWWEEFRQDVRFALRQCRRQPGFTAAAVLTLALGLGATTAIYSVVHAVVLAPLPIANPDRTIGIFTSWNGNLGGLAVGNFEYIRQRTTTMEIVAGVQYVSFNLTEGATPERILGARTTWSYFNVMGVAPLHGRSYSMDEDQPGRATVAVLNHRFWQRRFAGDRSIIGRKIRLGGETYDVIGVMPENYDLIDPTTDVYVPIAFTAERLAFHDEHYLQVFALRKPDASPEQISQDIGRTALALRNDFPRDAATIAFEARTMHEFLVDGFRTRLFVLMAAVTLVLLIACVNVANLLIARLAARSRELAIRAAIGAGRGRIVRQVLTESLVLASLGGIGGLIVARWTLPLLVANAPAGIPRLTSASLNEPVVAVAVGLVFAAAVLVGLLPSWQATRRADLRDDLGDGRGAGSRQLRPWVRQTLIAAQSALVLVVLSGAALLVRSAINLQQTPVGFDPSGVLTARVTLPSAQYREPAQLRATFNQFLERVAEAGVVEAVALDSQPPLVGGGGSNGLIPEGRPQGIAYVVQSRSHFVSPDYFRVLRMPLRSGRVFTPQDTRRAPLVMVINESLAREAFGNADPIGKRLSCCEGTPTQPSYKIVVGVVADVKHTGPANLPGPEFYLPFAQIPDIAFSWRQNTMNVVARSRTGDPAALVDVIRGAVTDIDPTLPIFGVTTLEDGLRQTLAPARFNTALMTLLGVVGLILAALGIYSVIAWLVAQRTREIGVRMALGASASAVVRDVTTHGLKPVIAGLSLGVLAALGTGKLLEGQLFQVSARDPLALAGVVVLMVVVAAIAAMVPARRAASIDPSRALHDS